jgi:Arc/MetJ family transcription regulator
VRTTIDIDPALLEKAEEIMGEKSPSKAVNKALAEYVRRRRIAELRASLGTWTLNLDDWYEVRHEERT